MITGPAGLSSDSPGACFFMRTGPEKRFVSRADRGPARRVGGKASPTRLHMGRKGNVAACAAPPLLDLSFLLALIGRKHRKPYPGFEQIAVNIQVKGAPLEQSQAFGNGQP